MKQGFSLPYIHSNQMNMHLPLPERVQKFVSRCGEAAAGLRGRTLFQSIRPRGEKTLLGISMLIEMKVDSPFFIGADLAREWEVGYLTDVDYQGQGIATEALYHCILHALKNNWGLTGLWASIDPARAGSIAVALKLGLECVRTIPAGASYVPFLNEAGEPAARNIYRTPKGWSLEDRKIQE